MEHSRGRRGGREDVMGIRKDFEKVFKLSSYFFNLCNMKVIGSKPT